MGVYAAMSGAGAAVGLILGGALTEYDWRWTFFINMPIGLLVAVLAPRFLAESRAADAASFDLAGAITGTAGLVGIVYGLTHAADPAGADPVTLTSLALGVALLVVFVVIEARARTRCCRSGSSPNRTRGVSLFVMLRRRRGDVRDVLLPRPLHPAGARLQPAQGRVRVPAVLASASSPRRRDRLDAGQPDRPALDLRCRCACSRAVGMFGFSQLTSTARMPATCCRGSSSWPSGSGLTFVPLTLTAVAGVATRTPARLGGPEHGAADRWRDRPGGPHHRVHARLRGPDDRARRPDPGAGAVRGDHRRPGPGRHGPRPARRADRRLHPGLPRRRRR